jgi:hypothetical protein
LSLNPKPSVFVPLLLQGIAIGMSTPKQGFIYGKTLRCMLYGNQPTLKSASCGSLFL